MKDNIVRQAPQKDDLRPDMRVFIPALLVVLFISLPAVIAPKRTEEFLTAGRVPDSCLCAFCKEFRNALSLDYRGIDSPVRLFCRQPFWRHKIWRTR